MKSLAKARETGGRTCDGWYCDSSGGGRLRDLGCGSSWYAGLGRVGGSWPMPLAHSLRMASTLRTGVVVMWR